jgi:sugar O-acyltransferase (sialic acid O-acetyltransferase NeuD family)
VTADAAPLLIFPYNGNGIEALDALGPAFRCIGFVDDLPGKWGPGIGGLAVRPRAALAEHPQARVLAVPGSPASYLERRPLIESLGIAGDRWATVVHPAARVSPLAVIGRNVLIMAGVVVTSDAVIGDHVCVLPNTVVHHGVRIGAWSLVGANVTIAGGTRIGDNCYIGSGASLKNGITIGDRALVGLGSVVLGSVEAGRRVAGCPARPLG